MVELHAFREVIQRSLSLPVKPRVINHDDTPDFVPEVVVATNNDI